MVKYSWYTALELIRKREKVKHKFKFDAFLSYCNRDEDWVRMELLKRLEGQRNPPYRLCLHYRHFLPGRSIADNIVSAVQSSRKVIMVITRHYLKSG